MNMLRVKNNWKSLNILINDPQKNKSTKKELCVTLCSLVQNKFLDYTYDEYNNWFKHYRICW